MNIDLKTVSKMSEAVNKIRLWAKEHTGLILIVAVVAAGIAFLVYKQVQKKKPLRDKQGHYLKKGVKPVFPGQEIPPGDVE